MFIKKGDNKNLLECFDNITIDLISSNVEEAKVFLNEEGFDPNEELQYGLKQIKKLQFLAQAKLNKAKDNDLLEKAFHKLKQSFEKNSQKAGDILKELLIGKNTAVQYRKLENWTDNEIRDVLNDVDLVDLLEQLDQE